MSGLPKNKAGEEQFFLEKLIRATRGEDKIILESENIESGRVRKVLSIGEVRKLVTIFGTVQPESTALIPKDWKPKNPEHAAECLQFWIGCIDGRHNLRAFIRELGKEHFAPTSMKGLFESLEIVEGFVDGCRALLEEWQKLGKEPTDEKDSTGTIFYMAYSQAIMDLAKAQAPRMAQAGFEVPK